MTIIAVNQFHINFPGNNNIIPRLGQLYAPSNTLAELTTAGALDGYLKQESINLLPTDCLLVSASNGMQFYKCVFTAGSCQLTALP